MKSKFITQFIDEKYYVMIPLNTKDFDKAVVKGDEVLNDLLSCIDATIKSEIHTDSPNFLKSINSISRKIWRLLD